MIGGETGVIGETAEGDMAWCAWSWWSCACWDGPMGEREGGDATERPLMLSARPEEVGRESAEGDVC